MGFERGAEESGKKGGQSCKCCVDDIKVITDGLLQGDLATYNYWEAEFKLERWYLGDKEEAQLAGFWEGEGMAGLK